MFSVTGVISVLMLAVGLFLSLCCQKNYAIIKVYNVTGIKSVFMMAVESSRCLW